MSLEGCFLLFMSPSWHPFLSVDWSTAVFSPPFPPPHQTISPPSPPAGAVPITAAYPAAAERNGAPWPEGIRWRCQHPTPCPAAAEAPTGTLPSCHHDTSEWQHEALLAFSEAFGKEVLELGVSPT